ncbi:MAG: DUF1501 domain-containing protein [Planctomycetia bacterium]|nr:DUF1501 domain-containing protein [Planctomycetia bacterium]
MNRDSLWNLGVARRTLLQAGGTGLLGLSLLRILRAQEQKPARAGRAKSVVFLYQFGGPSHVDTFDMKPDAPDGVRSKFSQISTSLPGLEICDLLPETAKVMDKVTLVRTVYHNMKNHNSASYYALTGHAPPLDDIRLRDSVELFPAYGSVVDRLAPLDGSMPTFVAYPYVIRDGAVTPGQHASFLGKKHDPLLITEDPNGIDFKLPELSLPSSLSAARLDKRREIQKLIDRQTEATEQAAAMGGLDAYYERTLAMLSTPAVRNAFDLSAEPELLRRKYGRTTYGQGCLLARRLVEAGVKFVNVYFSSSIGGQSTTDGGWDTHGFNNTFMYPILKARHLPLTDHTLPVFLNDLDERGLLDSTLVVWMGEFGRTPKLNSQTSRDHWPQCYTVLLAGGGVKRGYIHGRSDKQGAFPDRDGVPIEDLAATMFSLLGIDPSTEVVDRLNRPLPISSGRPVVSVMA